MFWTEVLKYVIAILSSLTVAIAGWWIVEWIKLNTTKNFFYYTIYQLKEAVLIQIELYREFVKDLKASDMALPSHKIAYGFNTNTINFISQQDLFKILVKGKNKLDNFKKFVYLNDSLEIIKNIADTSENYYHEFDNKFNEYIDEYNDVFVKIRSKIYENEYLKIKEISALTRYYSEPDFSKYSLNDTLNKFIEPLTEIAKQRELTPLLEILPDALLFIYKASGFRKNGITKFENDLKNLKKTVMHLDELIKSNKKLFKKDLDIEIK